MDSSISQELSYMDPDQWNNIPVCLVKAFKVVRDQFHFSEHWLNNFTFFHREHLRIRELQLKGLEHYVARSNDTLRQQIDFNCNRLLEKVLKFANENIATNKKTQALIAENRQLTEE
jgi:hypothetical protein